MEVKTKYSLDGAVWFLNDDGKGISGKITAIYISATDRKNDITYHVDTDHRILSERRLFISREELLKSI